MQGREKHDIPEKTLRSAESSGTFPTTENEECPGRTLNPARLEVNWHGGSFDMSVYSRLLAARVSGNCLVSDWLLRAAGRSHPGWVVDKRVNNQALIGEWRSEMLLTSYAILLAHNTESAAYSWFHNSATRWTTTSYAQAMICLRRTPSQMVLLSSYISRAQKTRSDADNLLHPDWLPFIATQLIALLWNQLMVEGYNAVEANEEFSEPTNYLWSVMTRNFLFIPTRERAGGWKNCSCHGLEENLPQLDSRAVRGSAPPSPDNTRASVLTSAHRLRLLLPSSRVHMHPSLRLYSRRSKLSSFTIFRARTLPAPCALTGNDQCNTPDIRCSSMEDTVAVFPRNTLSSSSFSSLVRLRPASPPIVPMASPVILRTGGWTQSTLEHVIFTATLDVAVLSVAPSYQNNLGSAHSSSQPIQTLPRQPSRVVARWSSFQPEFVFMAEVTNEIAWMKGLLGELGPTRFVDIPCTTVRCDNQGDISQTLNHVMSEKVNHVDVKFPYIFFPYTLLRHVFRLLLFGRSDLCEGACANEDGKGRGIVFVHDAMLGLRREQRLSVDSHLSRLLRRHATNPPPPPSVFYLTQLVRLLASHLDEPGSIPGWVTPVFSHVAIVPGGFPRSSPVSRALAFRRNSMLTSLHPHRLSRPQEPAKSLHSLTN
ncbi:hypothetical protein PR048_029661 [Dryococelus australis]|uniref:Uncharacterized protein n=1 Tax=Dryococelus australis TaxID=614101 RepID=A0ABQ9GE07_9NEOP|nr:hypothetical protein PR048_029661 [Dryococelus australis]